MSWSFQDVYPQRVYNTETNLHCTAACHTQLPYAGRQFVAETAPLSLTLGFRRRTDVYCDDCHCCCCCCSQHLYVTITHLLSAADPIPQSPAVRRCNSLSLSLSLHHNVVYLQLLHACGRAMTSTCMQFSSSAGEVVTQILAGTPFSLAPIPRHSRHDYHVFARLSRHRLQADRTRPITDTV